MMMMMVVRLRVGSGLVPVSQRYRNAAGRCVDCTNGPHPRPVHTTALVHSKNVLKKLLSKSKKKTWYETPPPTPSLLNLPKKKDHEDSHRCKVLNTILFKAVSDLLTSAQVSLARDFSSCRVFWKTSRDAQRDELIQKTLERNAPHIRITIADEVGPSSHSSQPALYGIDHELLNKQIADWCQQSKKEEHSQPHELQQEQLLAIAEHKKQQIIKKRKRKAPPRDDDITPRDFLLTQQDVAMPQRWGQILKEEEPAFKEEEADLQELTSLEEKTTS
ncbi:unnamed protein product [Merluccius merluccius]